MRGLVSFRGNPPDHLFVRARVAVWAALAHCAGCADPGWDENEGVAPLISSDAELLWTADGEPLNLLITTNWRDYDCEIVWDVFRGFGAEPTLGSELAYLKVDLKRTADEIALLADLCRDQPFMTPDGALTELRRKCILSVIFKGMTLSDQTLDVTLIARLASENVRCYRFRRKGQVRISDKWSHRVLFLDAIQGRFYELRKPLAKVDWSSLKKDLDMLSDDEWGWSPSSLTIDSVQQLLLPYRCTQLDAAWDAADRDRLVALRIAHIKSLDAARHVGLQRFAQSEDLHLFETYQTKYLGFTPRQLWDFFDPKKIRLQLGRSDQVHGAIFRARKGKYILTRRRYLGIEGIGFFDALNWQLILENAREASPQPYCCPGLSGQDLRQARWATRVLFISALWTTKDGCRSHVLHRTSDRSIYCATFEALESPRGTLNFPRSERIIIVDEPKKRCYEILMRDDTGRFDAIQARQVLAQRCARWSHKVQHVLTRHLSSRFSFSSTRKISTNDEGDASTDNTRNYADDD